MSGPGSGRPRLPVSLGESRRLFLRVVSILAFGLLVGITGAVLAIVVVDVIFWLSGRMSAVVAGAPDPSTSCCCSDRWRGGWSSG